MYQGNNIISNKSTTFEKKSKSKKYPKLKKNTKLAIDLQKQFKQA